jgi:hypothetical protein
VAKHEKANESLDLKSRLALARNPPSWYGLSAFVKVVPPSPAASTLTILAGPGDFALRISRREFCQKQQTDHRQTNADGGGLGLLESRGKSHWTKPLLKRKF